MRPALQGFNIITWYLTLATEEAAIKFMQKMGLIPTYLSPCPACPLCGYESKSQRMPTKKLVDGGEKWDLWALVKKYVHPETAVNKEAEQYKKIDRLIKECVRPALQGFNIITWYLTLATEEAAIKFMQKMGLIPTYLSPCPACPLCGYESKSQRMPTKKLVDGGKVGFVGSCQEIRPSGNCCKQRSRAIQEN
ncbi:hypothetical protein CDAR_106701 [Caerostris darwini]|uniref:Uncharacterized protein n=1 Tax=Caerostris darwini TaxID=1538125 RepID=A0AAV4Q6B3_9ARAC|nr:hypothetical protein CDAR_106701 [Caerostris darwini]